MQWRIELLGTLQVALGERVVTPLLTQKVAALLAYLAYYQRQSHPRELLIERLWPETDVEVGRHNLRSLLTLLRRQIEATGSDAGSLLIVSRSAVQLQPAVVTDVAEFTGAVEAAARAETPEARAERLAAAVSLYQGELLSGAYEPWVLAERQRLAELYQQALAGLAAAREESGDLDGAIEAAQSAVNADPLREEAHYDLMRLYAAAGRPSATVHQYQELERLLREELGETPSAAARALAEELRQNARTIVVARSLGNRERESRAHGRRLAAASEPIPETGAASPRPADPAVVAPPPETAAPPAAAPAAAPVPPVLPVQFTRFFGREEEIARVTETLCIPETRLVTLTGPGGSGKTRLAIAVAGRLQAQFTGAMSEAIDPEGAEPDEPARPEAPPIGLWFVSLAEIAEARRMGDAVRDAMGLPPATSGESLEQVMAALWSRSSAERPALLLLDNFEHLVDEGAPLVRRLLERVPSLKLLVTSRRRLELEGEQELAVLPLPTPRAPEIHNLQSLISYPSVQLFVDRARAARPEFRLTEANARAVVRLCDRLEGLPLAIELAAGRTGVLTPEQMLARLEDTGARSTPAGSGGRFELLVSRRRDVSARHRSLRAAMEGSYQSLTPELQRFFARLSVFRGGWTLEAAETICGEGVEGWALGARESASDPTPNAQRPTPTLEYLEHLRESSLIVAEEAPGSGAMRYRMLETLREYAGEKLAEGREREAVRARHAGYFLTLAEEARSKLHGPEMATWFDRLTVEHDNLRAALEWCQAAGTDDAGGHGAEIGLRLAAALYPFWEHRRHDREGRAWLEQMLARGTSRTTARARALIGAGCMAKRDGDSAVAQASFEESLAIMRELGDKRGIADVFIELALVAGDRGDDDTARALNEESLALMRGCGDLAGISRNLFNLGCLALRRDDEAEARRLWEECRSIDQTLGIKAGYALWALGDLAFRRGDHAEAERFWGQLLRERQVIGFELGVPSGLENLALLAAQAEPERAVRLWAAAAACWEALGIATASSAGVIDPPAISASRAALGEAAFAAAWAAGQALSPEQAVAEGMRE